MNNKIKTFVFQSLNLFPNFLGYKIYHTLQKFSENKNIEAKIKSTEKTFNEFITICEALKIDLKNKNLLEIGSGWLPIFPYFLLYKSKVKTVFTYDLNRHYQKKSISKLNAAFSKLYKIEVVPNNENSFKLPSGVAYFPSKNIINSELPQTDVVFSRFVLEHVTPEDIYEMHKKFLLTATKGSYIIHFISPSDHRAYSDKSLSLQDFLKYSKTEWDKIQTKFDYHNRLRLPQYLSIFNSLGLEIVYLTYNNVKMGTLQHDLFKKLDIHEDYKSFSEEELTAGSINIVLKV